MKSDTTPFQELVDRLREAKTRDRLNLVDVLSLAEVMLTSVQAFFSSIDTQIYSEFRVIEDYILQTKDEIASLRPSHLKEDRLPTAGRELDAIVQQTETATHTIMSAAEAIMSADKSDFDAYSALVDKSVLEIFEACAFQDITGQRVSKVVNTLQFIEERITKLADVLGPDQAAAAERAEGEEEDPEESRRKKLHLHGPQLDGEGVDQDDIDAMFG